MLNSKKNNAPDDLGLRHQHNIKNKLSLHTHLNRSNYILLKLHLLIRDYYFASDLDI